MPDGKIAEVHEAERGQAAEGGEHEQDDEDEDDRVHGSSVITAL